MFPGKGPSPPGAARGQRRLNSHIPRPAPPRTRRLSPVLLKFLEKSLPTCAHFYVSAVRGLSLRNVSNPRGTDTRLPRGQRTVRSGCGRLPAALANADGAGGVPGRTRRRLGFRRAPCPVLSGTKKPSVFCVVSAWAARLRPPGACGGLSRGRGGVGGAARSGQRAAGQRTPVQPGPCTAGRPAAPAHGR